MEQGWKTCVSSMSYEGSDDDEAVKKWWWSERKTFWGLVKDEIEACPKTTLNPKVVQAMKNLQASNIEDCNKIVEPVTQEESAQENSIFLLIWILLPW